MDNFSGKYLLESSENLGPFMRVLGISEDLLTKMVGAENKITLTISQNTEGSFNLSISHSTASELNFSSTFKLGETTKIEKPWPLVQTVNKINDHTWSLRRVMGTNTVVEEFVATNYGMTAKANIEGTALSCTEEFKRVDPIVSGFYVFDSQKGLEETTKIILPMLKFSDIQGMKPDFAFRITETAGGITMEKRKGDHKAVTSIILDQEYSYSEPGFLDETRVTTKLGPGCFTTVCTSNISDTVWENTMVFGDLGFEVTVTVGGFESTEFYTRKPDLEGTWRVVSHCGMEGYLCALGVTGATAEEMISSITKDYCTMERQAGGKLKILSNSKYFPQEMLIKVGEPYSMELSGIGRIQGVMTEQHDTVLNVWRFGGKTVSITEKISGDFMVSEYVVHGNKTGIMKTICARD